MTKAVIELTERSRAIWFCSLPKVGDWMAHIEEADGGRFKLLYRFRYYRDSDVWDSKDEKHWYRMEAADLAKGIETLSKLAQGLKEKSGGELWELKRGSGTLDEFAMQLKSLPFAHSKFVPK